MRAKMWGGANSTTCPPAQKSGGPLCPPGSAVYGTPTGDGGFPYNFFFKGGSKIGLKCSVLAARTFEPGKIAS